MPSTPANALNITQTGIQVFDGTATFTGTTTTQYNTLIGGTSNTIGNVSPGTSTYVLTSNGASANPSYQALPFTQMPWTDETGTSFAVIVGNGYFFAGSSGCTTALPASPSQGNSVSFAVDTSSAQLTLTANTGQTIRVGKAISASAGTAKNNFQGDALTLVYRASDTCWVAIPGTMGTWTVT